MTFGGASRSHGPDSSRGVEGCALQTRLQDQGAPFHDGLKLMHHIINHNIAARIAEVNWIHERSTLQHEYLVLSIILPDDVRLSWVRIERMGNIGSTNANTESRRAGFQIAMAPLHNDLRYHTDELLARVGYASEGPTLVDLAHFVVIMYQEVPDYTLLHHNCWWLARQLFKILVSNYLPDNREKRKLMASCSWQTMAQVEAPYHSAWRGRLVRDVLLVLTLPAFPIAWPIIIGGSVVMAASAATVLYRTEKKINARVQKYLGAEAIAH